MKTYLFYYLILEYILRVCIGYCTSSTTPPNERVNNTSTHGKKANGSIDFSVYRHAAFNYEFPYHVAIALKYDNSVLCQGALIDFDWILTSASCFKSYYDILKKDMHVVMGTVNTTDPGTISRNILFAVYHPKFEPLIGANDLVLIQLDSIIKDKSGRTKPIDLSTSELPSGTICEYSSIEDKNNLYGYTMELMDLSEYFDYTDGPEQILKYYCTIIHGVLFIIDINLPIGLTSNGSPLVCGNKLYAIKTSDRYFTGVTEIQHWVNSVTSEKYL